MRLKQIIQRDRIGLPGADYTLEMPGEPLIYSIKFSLARRSLHLGYLRNRQWYSILRSSFNAYFNTKTPVVLVAQFYVSPPDDYPHTSNSALERTPAVDSYELCDYLLSLMDMLMHVLINSYRQIVRIETEKWYSKKPRIMLKFMKWSDYEHFYGRHSPNTKAQGIVPPKRVGRQVQSKRKGNETSTRLRRKRNAKDKSATNEGPIASDCTLSTTTPEHVHTRREEQNQDTTTSQKA